MGNKKEIRLFIRFLKEHCEYKNFIKTFNSVNGIEFRKFHNKGKDVDLATHLSKMDKKLFIFTAFPWDNIGWQNLHNKWFSYLNKKIRK